MPAAKKNKKARQPKKKTNSLPFTAPPTRAHARGSKSKKYKPYSDEKLCQDLACGDFTTEQIAERHKVSTSLVRQIARGDLRPELKVVIDLLYQDLELETRRLFRSKVRHMAARLIQQTSKEGMAGVNATELALRLGGITPPEGEDNAVTIVRLPFAPPSDSV